MKYLLISIMFILIISTLAMADMGAIIPYEKVSLTEPGQKAIIAHDGFEEMLILSTDFNVNTNAKVVRFIPFPSQVKIDIADPYIFQRIDSLIKKHNLSYLRFLRGKVEKKEGVDIISVQTLGPHKIIQVKVTNFEEFKVWVKKLFKDEGIEKKGFTQKEEDVISFYLNRSMNFFVFDIVSLSEDINHIAPVVYRFNTNYFYYPLVTSSVIKGEGKIELVIFTNQGGISEKILRFISPHPWKVSETAIVTGEEMEKIYKELPKLMGAHAIMGVVQYRGPYNFSYDIWIEMPIYQIKPYNPYKKQKE